MNFIRLLKAEFIMLIGEIKNYYLNYIFYNIGILVIFLGIMHNFNDGAGSIVVLVGLLMWQTCSSSLNYISNVIEDEAMIGTLEQIELTKTKIQTVMNSKVLINFIFVMFKSSILFIITFFINLNKFDLTNINFVFVLTSILCVSICTISFYMIGELFGGLSLYFKRIGAVVSVIGNFLLLFSGIINEVSYNNALYYVTPISSAIGILRCIECNSFSYVFINHIIYFLIISTIYSLVGIITFRILLKKAKVSGNLGHY